MRPRSPVEALRSRTLVVATAGITVLALLALVVRGCNGPDVGNLNFPTPPSTVTGGTTSTAIPDLTKISLTPVPTGPPRPVAIVPGGATLTGVVIGPTGAIPGATVLAERVVGDAVGATTVAVQPDGTWKLTGVLGGRYRVRAWRAPDLALTNPQILFLRGNETQNLSLTLSAFNGVAASATVTPNSPQLGQVVNLVVQVTTQAVGNDGVVRAAPLAGATVDLTSAPNVTVTGATSGTTDGNGRVGWLIACGAPGPEGLSVTVNTANTFQLSTPDCGSTVYVPPTTTTTPPSVTTTTIR